MPECKPQGDGGEQEQRDEDEGAKGHGSFGLLVRRGVGQRYLNSDGYLKRH
jgi:hypothetical protein